MRRDEKGGLKVEDEKTGKERKREEERIGERMRREERRGGGMTREERGGEERRGAFFIKPVTTTLATFLIYVPQFVLFCICLTALNGSKMDFCIGPRT